jgi:hypothetical protein
MMAKNFSGLKSIIQDRELSYKITTLDSIINITSMPHSLHSLS